MTSPQDTEELKPCPWCNSPPRDCPDNSYGEASVDCPNEDCPVRPAAHAELDIGETLADAKRRWNTRPDSPVTVMREALGELEQRATATLAALDDYNEKHGTYLVGPSFLKLGKSVAKAREALARISR